MNESETTTQTDALCPACYPSFKTIGMIAPELWLVRHLDKLHFYLLMGNGHALGMGYSGNTEIIWTSSHLMPWPEPEIDFSLDDDEIEGAQSLLDDWFDQATGEMFFYTIVEGSNEKVCGTSKLTQKTVAQSWKLVEKLKEAGLVIDDDALVAEYWLYDQMGKVLLEYMETQTNIEEFIGDIP